MNKRLILTLIFIISVFLYFTCISKFFFSFYYITTEGDDYYHSKVTENILLLNYGKNIKSVGYCFTDENVCSDYLTYDGDLSSKILNLEIDYPDSSEGKRICVKVEATNSSSVHCDNGVYVVDSVKPVIKSLYSDILIEDIDGDLENLFEASSDTGIKDFSCDYDAKTSVITCKAVGNNTLVTTYSKKVYTTSNRKLEGKSILFAGDSITEACSKLDSYDGFAGRVGLSNYMNWKNVGKSGATISEGNNSVTDQIKDQQDEDYDYVILQGGINDMHNGVPLGTMSECFERECFNDSTYAGGLEKLFYYTKKYNPDSKIGFIITYQTPNSDWGDNVTDRTEQIILTRQICEKWGIPYLDLYDGVVYDNGNVISYSDVLKVDTGEMFYKDREYEVHLDYDGYNVVSKYISAWINTL